MVHPAVGKPWYPFTEEEDRELSPAEKLLNPWWFLPLLRIVDVHGQEWDLVDMFDTQVRTLQAILRWKQVIVVKPRQTGTTTITLAFFFWYLYTQMGALGALSLAHDEDLAKRLNDMLHVFGDSLPGMFKPEWMVDNAEWLKLRHNGAQFVQRVAGGRGQGRGFTFQLLHATEMGSWPKGSAAAGKKARADAAVWTSVLSTLHAGPHKHIIVESTGHGPTGLFYDLIRRKHSDDRWGVLFFPWYDYSIYEAPAREGLDPAKPLDPFEERDLAEMLKLGLDEATILRKLQWRRDKVSDTALEEFLQEYPGSWQDPFLVTGREWFDVLKLSQLATRLPEIHGEYVEFEEPEEGREYFVGMDTSGGVKKDYAYISVLREDNVQVARWRCNTAKPHLQAKVLARICARFNGALALVEVNNYGKAVIRIAFTLGVRLWVDENGKWFQTQRGRAGTSKDQLYDYAAEMLAMVAMDPWNPSSGLCTVRDPIVVDEAITLMEDETGNLCAPDGKNDDAIDGYALSLWCARRRTRRYSVDINTPSAWRDRMQRDFRRSE